MVWLVRATFSSAGTLLLCPPRVQSCGHVSSSADTHQDEGSPVAKNEIVLWGKVSGTCALVGGLGLRAQEEECCCVFESAWGSHTDSFGF